MNFTRATTFLNGGFICGAGEGLTDLSFQISQERNLNSKNTSNFIRTEVPVNSEWNYEINFDNNNRVFELKNLNGALLIPKSYAGYVELRITFWRAEDDYENQIEDENLTQEKIIHQEFIKIRDNKIVFSDGFLNKEGITEYETENYLSVEVDDLMYSFETPDDIDFSEELIVQVEAFSDPDNERIKREELEKSKLGKLNVFPNPSNGRFNLNLNSNQDLTAEIKLFDARGLYISNIYNGKVYKNETVDISIEKENLASGIYFITVQGKNGFFELKKITIKN